MNKVPGKDDRSLRALAVLLARECYFGDTVLLNSSPSGKAYQWLNMEKLAQIRGIVRQRAQDKSDIEFEDSWGKCIESISKLSLAEPANRTAGTKRQ